MAVHLINAISAIPASPAAGDIIRFSAAITTGIPSTLKKVDGTTTETAIAVGSEYRYYGTNWLKIGSDVSATPLKDVSVLASTEFSTAILAAVHNETASGRIRKFGMSILHKALQAVNPLQFSIEDVTLYNRTAITDLPQSSNTVPISLDIRTGVTRHNFDDGYFAFTFLGRRTTYTTKSANAYRYQVERFILKHRWFATQDGNEVINLNDSGVTDTPRIWKASNTTFFAHAGVNKVTGLYSIIGHKLKLGLQTP